MERGRLIGESGCSTASSADGKRRRWQKDGQNVELRRCERWPPTSVTQEVERRTYCLVKKAYRPEKVAVLSVDDGLDLLLHVLGDHLFYVGRTRVRRPVRVPRPLDTLLEFLVLHGRHRPLLSLAESLKWQDACSLARLQLRSDVEHERTRGLEVNVTAKELEVLAEVGDVDRPEHVEEVRSKGDEVREIRGLVHRFGGLRRVRVGV